MKISKDQFLGELHVIGLVTKAEVVQRKPGDAEDTEKYHIRLKYNKTNIFIYETKPKYVERMKKYRENDVIEVWGKFVAEWFPGAKSSLPVINELINIRKLGILKA